MSFYEILGVSPKSSQAEIRDAYRRKSKQYHPDTTLIDKAQAATLFQSLNQAYDTLRFPDKRQKYDAKLATARLTVKARSPELTKLSNTKVQPRTTTAFLAPEDRPLSAGEIFALFILGLTFLFCLLVALFLGIARGEMLVQSFPQDSSPQLQVESVQPPSKSRPSQKKNPKVNAPKINVPKVDVGLKSPKNSNVETKIAVRSQTPTKQLSPFLPMKMPDS